MESHLLQMRGLKRKLDLQLFFKRLSHLLQMRGLKLSDGNLKDGLTVSHLLQMRGLKLINPEARKRVLDVASFTDAWIETGIFGSIGAGRRRRIFYRCVD